MNKIQAFYGCFCYHYLRDMVVVQNEIWVVDKRSQLHLETVSVCGNGVLKLQFTEAQR